METVKQDVESKIKFHDMAYLHKYIVAVISSFRETEMKKNTNTDRQTDGWIDKWRNKLTP